MAALKLLPIWSTMTIYSSISDSFHGSSKPHLFLDFDGTISKIDVIDALLEKFADPRWLDIEKEWVEGKIGSRECLKRQFAFVNATPQQLVDVIDTMEIDDGFRSLLKVSRDNSLPIHIVSDGFEEYIRRMLARHLGDSSELAGITIAANSLFYLGGNWWDTAFRYPEEVCENGCATCKPAVIRLHTPVSSTPIFVGDGLSDRFAASYAGVVFAKSKLAGFCRERSIEFTPFDNLEQVADCLREMCESTTPQFTVQRDGSRIYTAFPAECCPNT